MWIEQRKTAMERQRREGELGAVVINVISRHREFAYRNSLKSLASTCILKPCISSFLDFWKEPSILLVNLGYTINYLQQREPTFIALFLPQALLKFLYASIMLLLLRTGMLAFGGTSTMKRKVTLGMVCRRH